MIIVMLSVTCLLDSLSHAGVYGNVLRVKILFNKKDSALVEYSDPGQAIYGSVDHSASLLIVTFCCCYQLVVNCRNRQLMYCSESIVLSSSLKHYLLSHFRSHLVLIAHFYGPFNVLNCQL